MNGFFKHILVIGFLLLGNVLIAQDLEQAIQSLEKDFRSFNYKKVIEKGQFLLADPYTNKEDSLRIYNYILSSAYAVNDTVLAKKIVLDILACEPSFAPNPRETSPKIIEFFNYVKEQNRPLAPVKRDTIYLPEKEKYVLPPPLNPFSLVSGALIPGSGHLLEGFKSRGYIFSSVSILLLSGTIYAGIETGKRYDTYMAAYGNADYDHLYNEYNQIYKVRNTLLIAYGLWSLYGLFDLQNQFNLRVSLKAGKEHTEITVSLRF